MRILDNWVVQILLGIGAMVFLITLGESFAKGAARRTEKLRAQQEARIRSAFQGELNSLREEMNNLKSTLLEHSMSLDRNVEGLKYRLDTLETKRNEVRT